eukprot:TRINITY_DN346_c0_g2_i2.p1 TRINITY_DN346_c0_g2~~TRINITY_DN346_c0_g2_i2.p1  ORF type:complete len:380 (+),score=64.86 TRINITY_DN346_c0_g2_i2:79-1218(+)
MTSGVECVQVLVDGRLERLVEEGRVRCGGMDMKKFVQPASIDLPCGHSAYLVKEKVLPFQKKVSELIGEMAIEQRPLASVTGGCVLLKGQTYLIPCAEVSLPPGHKAQLSPKSSIGRIDVLVRGVTDECGMYDYIPPTPLDAEGPVRRSLWLEVMPRSFNIRLQEGVALTQMMVYGPGTEGPPDLSKEDVVYSRMGEPLEPNLVTGNLVLSLNVPRCGASVGFEALPTNEVLDLCRGAAPQDPDLFFRPVAIPTGGREGRLTLEKDHFYILSTAEHVRIPLHLSAEMFPFSHHVGELRAHYAGFFDPGFGYGEKGEVKGREAVLEVRPHETVTVFDGQPICLMKFLRNDGPVKKPYGSATNHYHDQTGPQLAKYFRSKA